VSKYSAWWAGHCFGPRYWTDVTPLFGILLGFTLDWAWARRSPALLAFAPTILFSVAVQMLGAMRYDGSWDRVPVNVDQNHERLWSWRDSVLVRCLDENPDHDATAAGKVNRTKEVRAR
jgi:hypothetical protein